ncbi:MAG TPA: 2-amino-4-hydroxy-6-hydroxymethyldihydropteridine diphosphokinase [Crocinitomicaceae bacterium]|nr:2-amino-4-hydroxy-6-hydroxymethyldihydropteridine diphosphokinase [Crocinitomicaceae bacterium]
MEKLTTVYLSLGSDLGDQLSNLEKAIHLISTKISPIGSVSRIYETLPLGFDSDTHFLNLCIELKTKLSPFELLNETQAIEQLIGRKEKSINKEYTSRIVDIDIILFGDKIIKIEQLEIPHSQYRKRNFVLFPLSDIANHLIDPISGLTIEQIKRNCEDDSSITISDSSIPI